MVDILQMTSTNLFIRPLLEIPSKDLDKFSFENAYIKDEIKGIDYKHAIYLLFRPGKYQEDFNDFVEEERKKGVVLDEYDYADGWVVVVFRYNEKWQNDILLILKGDYSKVSREYQEQIPDKAGKGSETVMSMQHHIFRKSEYVKKFWYDKYGLEFEHNDECWSLYPEREILTQENLNKII